ncbi:MAG: hypothetical protein ACRDJG_01560 [Actinomycetota bacterium]
MLSAIFLALAGAAFLVAVAARFDPERPPSEPTFGALRTAERGVWFARPAGRAIFALIPFGVFVGLAVALGLLRANVFVLLGGLAASMAGRGLLSTQPVEETWPPPWRPPVAESHPRRGFAATAAPWFVVLAWCVMAAALRFRTLDLGEVLAAQAVLGPSPLIGPPLKIAATVIVGLVGLAAAAAWVQGLPPLSGSAEREALDRVLHWGETALASAAVTATVWGPSLGAVTWGRVDANVMASVAASFGLTAAGVAAVSALRSRVARLPESGSGAMLLTLALLAGGSVLGASL